MSNDPNVPRFLRLTITDDGEAWLVELERNRIDVGSEDVCEILGMAHKTLDQLHAEVHLLGELERGRN